MEIFPFEQLPYLHPTHITKATSELFSSIISDVSYFFGRTTTIFQEYLILVCLNEAQWNSGHFICQIVAIFQIVVILFHYHTRDSDFGSRLGMFHSGLKKFVPSSLVTENWRCLVRWTIWLSHLLYYNTSGPGLRKQDWSMKSLNLNRLQSHIFINLLK